MKKVFLSMFLLASMTLSVVAQQSKGGKKSESIEAIKGLNLTDSQKTAIKELKQSYRDESRQRAEAHQDAIKAILTPEQQEKWDSKMGKRRNNGKRNTAPQTVKFDEATTAKIKTLNEELAKEVKAIKMTRLAPEEQQRRIKEVNEKYSALRSQAVSQAVDGRAPQAVKFDDDATAKVDELNTELQKEIKAIKMSRLAPDEQDRRIKVVNEKYSALRSQTVGADIKSRTIPATPLTAATPLAAETDLVAVNPIAPLVLFDAVTSSKLEALADEVAQQKKSVELSRIAPEMQQRKIEILDKNYNDQIAKVLAADPNVLLSGQEIPGTTLKLNAATVKKLNSLNEEYLQAEKAIRMTRIAPEMQQQRIKDLNALYADKRIAIVEAGLN